MIICLLNTLYSLFFYKSTHPFFDEDLPTLFLDDGMNISVMFDWL